MTAFVRARWFTPTGGRQLSGAVVHRMEAPDKPGTAMGTARYFQKLDADHKASAHRCYDPEATVRCVLDKDVAYHVPGLNHDFVGYELAGRSADNDWDEVDAVATLQRCAIDAADDARRYDWPIRWRVASDLLAGGDRRRGFTSHVEGTHAYPHLGSHTDPGPFFDPDHFIELVTKAAYGNTPPPAPIDHFSFLPGEPDMPLAPTAVVGFVNAAECGFPGLPANAGFELTADGGVKAVHDAPFFGSYPGLPPDARQGSRYFVGIAPNEDGTAGYTCWSNDSVNGYKFGPGLNGFK